MALKKKRAASGPIAEKAFWDTTDKNSNMLVPWYIMAAYAYYEQDNPILEDATFDKCAKTILDCWDKISHNHKHLITKDMLIAGTYIGEYPNMVKGAVNQIRKDFNGR
jgi:hypothetical protein